MAESYPVQNLTYEDLPLNLREIFRYAGVTEEEPLLLSCLKELDGKLCGRVCHTYLPHGIGPVKEPAVLFAATVGLMPDRLILKYGRLEPAKALYFQAIGAERIETLCDAFCADLKKSYPQLKPRISPGYGRLPLSLQREIFTILKPEHRIGLYLNERSLLMTPSKSVTAIVRTGEEGF